MNRRELVLAIAAHTDQDRKDVEATLQGFVDVVTSAMSKGDPVSIPGFAKFARVDRKARMGRNPATGETIRIKASRKARITPLKALKDVVNGVTAAPKVASVPKKAAPAKAAAKRAPAKKAPAKKAAAKKAPARKAPAKKAPARRR